MYNNKMAVHRSKMMRMTSDYLGPILVKGQTVYRFGITPCYHDQLLFITIVCLFPFIFSEDIVLQKIGLMCRF